MTTNDAAHNATADAYEVVPGVPSDQTYRDLRVTCGLSPKSAEATAVALPNTWYGVTLRHRPEGASDDAGTIVGMGRIVGDGGCFFQIVDICVLPDHQGRGLGKLIMGALTEELGRRAPATAYVSLIADGDARFLYERFGFRQTAPHGVGMFWAQTAAPTDPSAAAGSGS